MTTNDMDRPKISTPESLAAALYAAGVLPNPDFVRRFTITAEPGEVVTIAVELTADERLEAALADLDRVQVVQRRPDGDGATAIAPDERKAAAG